MHTSSEVAAEEKVVRIPRNGVLLPGAEREHDLGLMPEAMLLRRVVIESSTDLNGSSDRKRSGRSRSWKEDEDGHSERTWVGEWNSGFSRTSLTRDI